MPGTKRLVTKMTLIGAVAALIVAASGEAALADHQAPFDGTMHAYGEMVDYPLVFPVDGQVTFTDTFYAGRANGQHHAQDLMADKMTPIVAAASGTLRWVNWSSNPNDLNPDRCCSLVIEHDDGWQTWYIHMNNDTPGTDDGQGWGIAGGLFPGGRVTAGQLIGWVGDSGNAENTPSHLHFELYDPEGVIVNPYQALVAAQDPNCDFNCTPFETLRLWSTGSAVVELQAELERRGFAPGPIDGIFGPKTEAAVEAFQQAAGLGVNGVVDRFTWDVLINGAVVAAPPETGTGSGAGPEATSTPVITYGSRGPDVADLQSRLAGAGFDPGPVDGIFGPLTRSAVTNFQAARGFAATGEVDQATWDALVGGAVAPPAEVPVIDYGARGQQVADLQSRLDRLGFVPGPIDGIYGPMTKGAVARFQQAYGLEQTGIVDHLTWDTLLTL